MGVTLVELLVVLTILGVIAGVAGLAMRRATPAHEIDPRRAAVAAARRLAIDSARVVTIDLGGDTAAGWRATAYPDGSVVADTGAGIERLSGTLQESRHAR
jgi:prepilin-type N-terminal cleavage/methylation domain-containing protein